MKTPRSAPSFLSNPQQRQFRKRMLAWYEAHRRDLPWRANRDPYRVWLSEIMLQQTRVAAVIEHYQEFLRRFPTVEKLAAAREASVLAAWSGLGYYRRARMLHAAAKVVVREYGGKFPATAEAWRALPGVGRYTAAAIASIAFEEPVAVVDGNVERVLQRVSGKRLAGEELWKAAERSSGCQASRRFQSGDDGAGRGRVHAARAGMLDLSGDRTMCHARRDAARTAKPARQKKREIHYALRSSRWRGFSGTAAARCVADAGNVGVARVARARMERVALPSRCAMRSRSRITPSTFGAAPRHRALHGKWIPLERLRQVALTGLARKILRKAEML